jgi:general secretion pathway protein G
MVAAIGVLAALMAIAIPMYSKYRLQAQNAQAISDLRNLDLTIQIYRRTQGSLPSNLASLGVPIPSDPWGRSYEYLKVEGGGIYALFYAKKDFFEIPINKDFDLYSRGPDGATSSIVFLTAAQDDVMRGASGQYFGLASNY